MSTFLCAYRNPGLISLHPLCQHLGCEDVEGYRSWRLPLSLLKTRTCMKAAESTISRFTSGASLRPCHAGGERAVGRNGQTSQLLVGGSYHSCNYTGPISSSKVPPPQRGQSSCLDSLHSEALVRVHDQRANVGGIDV